MTADRGGTAGEAAAHARVAALFARIDRLTADDLARIGLTAPPDEVRRAWYREVDRATRASGRERLVTDVRARARDGILRRYAAGVFRPTWAGLNWGQSLGRAEDRVAVAMAVEDAAVAAALADVLDPETLEAMSLDELRVSVMAAGGPPEGAFILRRPRGLLAWIAVIALVPVLATLVSIGGAAAIGVPLALVAAAVAAVLLRRGGLERRGRGRT